MRYAEAAILPPPRGCAADRSRADQTLLAEKAAC